MRLLELSDNKKGGFVLGPSLPTNPLIVSSWRKAESRKLGGVFVITKPICFQINKHITKMLQKQGKRFDAFAWIV